MKVKKYKEKYKSGNGLKIIFYENNKIIGWACTANYNNKPNSFLHNMEVKEIYRNKGYGKKILEYMISHYNVDILYVHKNNHIAQNLYKLYRFRITKNFNSEFFIMERER